MVLALVGFAGGPLSMWLLRDRPPFETFHAYLGITVAALFATAGYIGWRLQHNQTQARDAHALFGALAVLFAAAAAVAGFVLLP